MYALQQLNDIYGKALADLRIILIHAGLRLLSFLVFFVCFFTAITHLNNGNKKKDVILSLADIVYFSVQEVLVSVCPVPVP